ncbi:MAG: ABC transporter ATP-binding protein [Candidatus Caccosoma sp.]|nr:ABC transporter ATP-binding protein [Candidatus Caccosoma sp.]
MSKIKYDKISTYFKLNKKSFILATISGIFYNVLMVLVPILLGKLIDVFKIQANKNEIIILAILFFLFIIFIQFNRFIKRYYVRDFANRMVLQMRTVSFLNMIHADIKEFNTTSKGDIMNKNLTDIKDSAEGVRKILTEVYDSIILITGYFISLFIMDYKTSLIISLFIALSILVAKLMKKIIYKTTASYKKCFSNEKDITLSCLKNEIYYRGFGVNDNYYKKFADSLDVLEKKSIKSMIYKGSLEPTYQAIALLGLFFVIYFCGMKVINETWLVGTFSAYLTTYMLVATKASKVGKVFNAKATLDVSWKRCLPYLKEIENENEIKIINNDVTLKANNLSFGFSKDFSVNNISFSLNKGEILVISGMVHTGKSTLLAALGGIYDYSGSIKLCGVELKDAKNQIKDNFIAYGTNNVEIFNDTLKYNVSFSSSSVKKELKMACFEDANEDEILSHSNNNLSGGEQKRLEIARCLYNSPKLILLDDPFNAIDIKMGEEIINNIKNNYKDSIVIIINNQKEILSKADKIIFLKKDNYLYGNYEELKKDKDFQNLLGGE